MIESFFAAVFLLLIVFLFFLIHVHFYHAWNNLRQKRKNENEMKEFGNLINRLKSKRTKTKAKMKKLYRSKQFVIGSLYRWRYNPDFCTVCVPIKDGWRFTARAVQIKNTRWLILCLGFIPGSDLENEQGIFLHGDKIIATSKQYVQRYEEA